MSAERLNWHEQVQRSESTWGRVIFKASGKCCRLDWFKSKSVRVFMSTITYVYKWLNAFTVCGVTCTDDVVFWWNVRVDVCTHSLRLPLEGDSAALSLLWFIAATLALSQFHPHGLPTVWPWHFTLAHVRFDGEKENRTYWTEHSVTKRLKSWKFLKKVFTNMGFICWLGLNAFLPLDISVCVSMYVCVVRSRQLAEPDQGRSRWGGPGGNPPESGTRARVRQAQTAMSSHRSQVCVLIVFSALIFFFFSNKLFDLL